ncbi:MAG: response regulator [Candidatus Omnitrophica bacterium]|nr:response regulator [Candidatus Omnitrophota bacterium]
METLQRKRILVVEDEEALAELLRIDLRRDGFEVHTESLGTTAITYAAEHPIDLVILDLKLPDINGLQVCKQLRRIYGPWMLPVVMLTALKEPIDQLKGFAHGADAYLTKPYDPKELKSAISLLL